MSGEFEMNIIDISWPISPDMTAYKDRRTVHCRSVKTFSKDGVRESELSMSSHTGTHVDAPAHFLKEGETIDRIPLDRLIGEARVIDMTHVDEVITADDLADSNIRKGEIIIFKTNNSMRDVNDPFNYKAIYLDHTAASYLAQKGVKSVGIDYLGIERNQPEHETHTILMKAHVVIVEGLRLAAVAPGNYFFVCLPLKIVEGDAAPARALLIEV